MDPNTFPTKGNLISAKNTLRLSRQGYELLDKKRMVLAKEVMSLTEKALEIQKNIDKIFVEAYKALTDANIQMGVSNVERFSFGVPYENSLRIKSRSVVGVEIPLVSFESGIKDNPLFGLGSTSSSLDEAFYKFNEAKELIVTLSMVKNSAHRLTINIKKTQKRANALKNVTIPKYENLVKQIQDVLEERERDEFTRLKVLKGKRG